MNNDVFFFCKFFLLYIPRIHDSNRACWYNLFINIINWSILIKKHFVFLDISDKIGIYGHFNKCFGYIRFGAFIYQRIGIHISFDLCAYCRVWCFDLMLWNHLAAYCWFILEKSNNNRLLVSLLKFWKSILFQAFNILCTL